MNQQFKICSKCKSTLPLSEFHKHGNGYKSRCKKCNCADARTYRMANPEHCKERDHQYYIEHREQCNKTSKLWRQHNAEKKTAYDIQYRQTHKEELKEYFRQYNKKNRKRKTEWWRAYVARHKEEIIAKQAEYRMVHKEELLLYFREYGKLYPEKRGIYAKIGYARRKNAVGSYTSEQWKTLCSFFDICPCCKKKVNKFSVDHIIPLTWEGSTNWIVNIQPLCKSCNTSKNNYRDTDYRPQYVREWAENQMLLMEQEK